MDRRSLFGVKAPEEQKDSADKKQSIRHSKAYHRYFEGYAEHMSVRDDGSHQIERYYVGDYYRQSITDGKRVLLRAAYSAGFLSSAALFFFAGTRRIGANHSPFVIAPQAAVILLLLWQIFVLISYLSAPRRMEVRMWRESSLRLITSSKGLAAALLIDAAATLLVSAMRYREELTSGLIAVLITLAAALIQYAVYRTEKALPYEKTPGDRSPAPEDEIIEA